MVPSAYACVSASLATITVRNANLPNFAGGNKNAATFADYDISIYYCYQDNLD